MKYTLSNEMLAPAIANILRFAECARAAAELFAG